jgi:hypothetical protein
MARVDAARAQLGIVGAQRYPQIAAGASGTATLGSETGARPIPEGEDRTAHLYRAGFTFAWEIDLWGKYRRANEAARAQLLATEEVRQAIAISLVSSVAHRSALAQEMRTEMRTPTVFCSFDGCPYSHLCPQAFPMQQTVVTVAPKIAPRSVVLGALYSYRSERINAGMSGRAFDVAAT